MSPVLKAAAITALVAILAAGGLMAWRLGRELKQSRSDQRYVAPLMIGCAASAVNELFLTLFLHFKYGWFGTAFWGLVEFGLVVCAATWGVLAFFETTRISRNAKIAIVVGVLLILACRL